MLAMLQSDWDTLLMLMLEMLQSDLTANILQQNKTGYRLVIGLPPIFTESQDPPN